MSRSYRSRLTRCALALLLIATISLLATSASAADASFTLDVTPATVGAGTTTTFDASITNDDLVATLDSVTVTAPPGFTLVTPSDGTFTGLALAPGSNTLVQVTATAPCGPVGDAGSWSATGSGSDGVNPVLYGMNTDTSNVTAALDVACSLAISNVGSGQKNTTLSTANFDPSGISVTVEVRDANNALTTAADGSTVTLALSSNPTALSGKGPENVSGGVATFASLKVSQASLAYTVTASSSNSNITSGTAATSNTFQIWDKDIKCAANTPCSGLLNQGQLKTEPSTQFASGNGILLSYGLQGQVLAEKCAPDTYNHLPSVVTIDSEGQDPTGDWVIKFTVSAAYDKQQSNNGVSFYQLCLFTTLPFQTLNNTISPSTVIGTTTYFFGLVQNKPKCSASAPCITSKTKTPAGEPVIVLRLKPKDPWTH
jgi:hypothetical protein